MNLPFLPEESILPVFNLMMQAGPDYPIGTVSTVPGPTKKNYQNNSVL